MFCLILNIFQSTQRILISQAGIFIMIMFRIQGITPITRRRIGLQIDLFEVLDIIFVLMPLLLIYFVLWLPINTNVKGVIRLVAGSVGVSGFIIFPFVSPISYRYCIVWFPVSLIFFVGATLLLSVYLIARSIVYLKKR